MTKLTMCVGATCIETALFCEEDCKVQPCCNLREVNNSLLLLEIKMNFNKRKSS